MLYICDHFYSLVNKGNPILCSHDKDSLKYTKNKTRLYIGNRSERTRASCYTLCFVPGGRWQISVWLKWGPTTRLQTHIDTMSYIRPAQEEISF